MSAGLGTVEFRKVNNHLGGNQRRSGPTNLLTLKGSKIIQSLKNIRSNQISVRSLATESHAFFYCELAFLKITVSRLQTLCKYAVYNGLHWRSAGISLLVLPSADDNLERNVETTNKD